MEELINIIRKFSKIDFNRSWGIIGMFSMEFRKL